MDDRIQASVQAIGAFTDRVMKGKYTLVQAEAELDRMEREFGEDAFLPETVTPKPKPWTKAYLEELERKVEAGVSSRDFLYHMAEVSVAIRWQTFRRRLLAVAAGLLAIAGALRVIVALMDKG